MAYSVRRATHEDLPAFAFADGAAFGFHYTEQDLQDAELIVDPQRFYLATDPAGLIVGVAGDYPLQLTVPGGMLDVPGVSWVSTRSTHRRRGILRQLMQQQLTDYAQAGYPVAVLTASEGGIYRRFGYGPASQSPSIQVDRRLARFGIATSPDQGEPAVELVQVDRARELAPGIHARWQAAVPGAVSRSPGWWDYVFADREHRRGGSALFYLMHPDGYVFYRVQENPGAGHTCRIVDYAPVTPEAHRALWQVLLGMDLFTTIVSKEFPSDDPLPLLLSDARQMRITGVKDGIWVRPLDVCAMLAARTYALELDVVIEVTDELLGDGRYRLRGGPDGASCERTDADPELRCNAAGLGSVYLGGTRLTALAAAGLVHGAPEQLRRADRALLADRAPCHGTSF